MILPGLSLTLGHAPLRRPRGIPRFSSAKIGRVIATAPFGSTGHESSRTIFGAAAIGAVSHAEAERTLDLLVEHGVNHIDTAASYGDAELRLAPWLREHRNRFFLATKTGERAYAAAREEIRRSLERMAVDQVDLIQLHCLVHPDEWELALSAEGALRAAIEARDEGLVRFIGVTGHGLTIAAMHQRSLERFAFDSVLFPYSHVITRDETYAADVRRLLATCRERDVAVQTIKSISRGPWGSKEPTAVTWYEPLVEQAHIDLAVHWVLGEPGIFLNSAGDLELLPRVLDAAERFSERPGDDELARLAGDLRLSTLFA
jgi:predicted aldo/keto reductase-like oxidoreductase